MENELNGNNSENIVVAIEVSHESEDMTSNTDGHVGGKRPARTERK